MLAMIVIKNPIYCSIVSLSPTTRNAKSGIRRSPIENNEVTTDVSALRSAQKYGYWYNTCVPAMRKIIGTTEKGIIFGFPSMKIKGRKRRLNVAPKNITVLNLLKMLLEI